MLRLIAMSALLISPPAYEAMKIAAYARHGVVAAFETDKRPFQESWHQALLDWVYPV